MPEKKVVDVMWDDSPVDVSAEVNFIWSIANKLRGTDRIAATNIRMLSFR